MVKSVPASLLTERLKLRRFSPEDLEPFAKMNADTEVMRHFPATLTLEETQSTYERIVENFDQCGFGLWAAELRTTRQFIGFIGLLVPSFEAHFTPCVEIGWRLKKEHWGQGLAPEGAATVMRDAFERVGLRELVSMTTTTNVPSMRVMEKIGMHRDNSDDFDHPMIADPHPLRRHVLYRIRAEEFPK